MSDRAVLIPPHAAKPTPAARIRAFVRTQIETQDLRWRLWTPVAFGCGCATYFALKSEPALWPLALAAVVAVGLWLAAKAFHMHRPLRLVLMLVACFALGLVAAKARAVAVSAPVAPAMAAPTVIEGWVVDVDSPGSAGARIILAPVRIRGLSPDETPVRLRATVRGEAPEPGQSIRLFAILNPPPSPAAPGAYDFGRGRISSAWAVSPSRWETPARPGWSRRPGRCDSSWR